jgi:hypothetical protein
MDVNTMDRAAAVQEHQHEEERGPAKGERPVFYGQHACAHLGVQALYSELSILDRLLTPLILVFMIVGVVIGEFVSGIQEAFDTVQLNGVSVRTYPTPLFPETVRSTYYVQP